MRLTYLPAFRDNYIWCLDHEGSALVVDPGDASVVSQWLKKEELSLTTILITHHHADHTAGIAQLKAEHNCQVFGPNEDIGGLDTTLAGDKELIIAPFGRFQVISTPGHTRAHLCYHLEAEGWLFSGDTLFSAGCGRAFECSPEQLGASLEKLAQLPDHTRICCAHEYTLSNLAFAAAVEPDNGNILRRRLEVESLRERGLPSLPVSLGLEKGYNPFLRSRETKVVAAASLHAEQGLEPGLATFAALRRWKDVF